MHMVDMSLSPQEAQDQYGSPTPTSQLPKYPYGLCICFGPEEIAKLGIEDECNVGDILHLHALAKVTSYSVRETEGGPEPRIEMVLAFIEAEDEGEEDTDADMDAPSRLYR